ncbi:X-ray repair cross-complementing protein 5 isoform X4 [Latimeria chalumnae]|uniref:X-ray repair cross-complementing protein 5 isoform X4 n=1 Tax=Latimeria chalumnae TaxID=7897 RepID=UPI00313B2832
MARAAKSAIVLCMDVGFSMGDSPPGTESSFEQAKKVMLMFVQRQVFAEGKDETALVLFGTDSTKNSLAKGDQYQNITVQRHLMLPDFDLLEDIQSGIQPGNQQADFLDALIVCMDLLQKETLGKKYEQLHIAAFTDLNSPFSTDQLDIITANLKRAGISLQFFLPFPLEGEDGSGDRGEGDRRGSSYSHKGLTPQQKEGLHMVRKVMLSLDAENGLDEVYTFRDGMECLLIFKKIERRAMAWPCQLTIGSNLSIRIVGYKAVTEERVKKSWSFVDAKTLRKEDVQRETVVCLNDDNETEVSKDDIIQGFRYGSDIVPFSKVDQEQMKYKSDGKCFAVLGFTKSSQCLMYVQLPYMEDLRQFTFASLKNNKKCQNSEDQLSAMDSLIDSMSLVWDDGEEMDDLFKVNKIPNPQFQRLFQCLQHKAFNPDDPLPPIDTHLREMLERPQQVTTKCQAPLERVKELFPLQDLGKKKDQKTAQQIFKDINEEEPDIKKSRLDEQTFNIANLAEGTVTSVGSVNPVKDFHALIKQKAVNFSEVSQQLIDRIYEMLETKGLQYYMKSINCIRAFREEAIKAKEVHLFNCFLQTLQDQLIEKALQEFWDHIVQDNISLITKDEAPDSSVTTEEAKQFLAPKENQAEAALPADEGGDVDDLLDMM